MQVFNILEQIDLGAVALPEFQRGYVWNREQVRAFMQSLYRRYPVGSLLVWVTARIDPAKLASVIRLAGPATVVVVSDDPAGRACLPQLPHDRPHDLVTLRPRGRFPLLDLVVAARGHLQNCADALDPQTPTLDDIVAVSVNERGYFLCWRSSSAPKKLAAAFKMSLARRSSAFSRLRRLSSASSSVVAPGRRP